MGVSTTDQPVEHERIDESFDIFARPARMLAQQFGDFGRPRATLALIFRRRHDAKRLTHVFLVDANDIAFRQRNAVIAFYDDRDFITESVNLTPSSGKLQSLSERQTEMLVLGMAVEFVTLRLEDVGRRDAARRYTPSATPLQERRLGLRTRQAELTGVARQAPGGLIPAQCAEAFGDLTLCQPFDLRRSIRQKGRQFLGTHELDGTGAIFTDIRDKGERIARRNMKVLGPPSEDEFVVRKKAPDKGFD